MDALKIIEQSSMKENAPAIEIGDFVKVYVRIKEGDKSRIRCSREQLSPRSTAASTKPLR